MPLCAVFQGAAFILRGLGVPLSCSKNKESWQNSMDVLGITCAALNALAIVQMRKTPPIRTLPGRQQRMQPRMQPQTALMRQRKVLRAEPIQDPAQDVLRWGILLEPLSFHVRK